MFNLYCNIDLMLNSLEYILPLCSVYCMVIISVDRWINYCTEIGRGFFFSYQRLLSNWLCEKIKKCWWCSVHRSPQPCVCCQAGSDFSMNSKDNW